MPDPGGGQLASGSPTTTRSCTRTTRWSSSPTGPNTPPTASDRLMRTCYIVAKTVEDVCGVSVDDMVKEFAERHAASVK